MFDPQERTHTSTHDLPRQAVSFYTVLRPLDTTLCMTWWQYHMSCVLRCYGSASHGASAQSATSAMTQALQPMQAMSVGTFDGDALRRLSAAQGGRNAEYLRALGPVAGGGNGLIL